MQNDAGQERLDPSSSNEPRHPSLADTAEMDVLSMRGDAPRLPEVPEPQTVRVSNGEAVWVSMQSPMKETGNEDSVAAFPFSVKRGVLVVADGLGGHRGGRKASRSIVRGMKSAFRKTPEEQRPTEIVISRGLRVPVGKAQELSDTDTRSIILDQIETSNRNLLRRRSGAATTLALVEISGSKVRTYHIGDSPILIVSQMGRIKHETIVHSPVGYAVESGMLTENDAISHQNRHIVSNVVGAKDMTVELGPWVNLSARDTVLLASDGLFDNLLTKEIVDQIRSGNLQRSVQGLAELAVERMCTPEQEHPSKPDDLTILAYRRLPPKKLKAASAK